MAPGKKPASATPRMKRRMYRCSALLTQTKSRETMPQLTMIRASQRRAPNLCRARLLGTSSRM